MNHMLQIPQRSPPPQLATTQEWGHFLFVRWNTLQKEGYVMLSWYATARSSE